MRNIWYEENHSGYLTIQWGSTKVQVLRSLRSRSEELKNKDQACWKCLEEYDGELKVTFHTPFDFKLSKSNQAILDARLMREYGSWIEFPF